MHKFWNWIATSRWRIVLLTLVLLLALDLGRSAYARVGYAQPVEPWQEAAYQAIVWPPGSDLPPGATLGQQVYGERCAVCHGPGGGGNGPAAPSMIPRPRDFTLGQYKYKSTPAGAPPTDEDLTRVVEHGLQASAMPYWSDLLSEAEIDAVVEYIKDFSPVFEGASPEPIDIPPHPPAGEASLALGAELYDVHCAGCHGADGRSLATFTDSRGYPVQARDLTAPWTFRGGSEPEQIWLRITTGLSPSPMPSFAEQLTPEERWAVVDYMLSLARTPPWEPGGTLDGPGYHPNQVKRGEYLVHIEMCGLCHTQINEEMIYSGDEYYLAGGMGIPAYPQGTFVSRNLTPDPETGLGNWTAEQIAAAIRSGRARDRYLNLWGMPWMFLHSFEQEDALAIGTYLKSRPPVENRIPLPLRAGFVETTVTKVLHSENFPPLGDPDRLTYKAGNFGQTGDGLLLREWPQRLLIAGQWLVLWAGFVAFFAASPRSERTVRKGRRWLLWVLALLGLALLGLLLWVIYSTPVLPFVPPAQINQAVTAGIPSPDPASFANPEQAALTARGEYLYKVTSCVFCHEQDGSGGSKISMRSFGTLWVRNISSDPATGIGSWSDAEIGRAIRSGVAKDGRALHWQGMTWDHFSNLAEEDLHAIIVFLRTLPPVENQVPEPAPPSAVDCEEYTFFLENSSTAGCGLEE